jgi:hypothetical protein
MHLPRQSWLNVVYPSPGVNATDALTGLPSKVRDPAIRNATDPRRSALYLLPE